MAGDPGDSEGRQPEMLFADQVGIRSYQVTGRTPIVRRTGNRFSVYAMEPRPRWSWSLRAR